MFYLRMLRGVLVTLLCSVDLDLNIDSLITVLLTGKIPKQCYLILKEGNSILQQT